MPTVFKAWVPNVSGALSFSTIGGGFYPTSPVRANLGDQGRRYIIAYQRRTLLDAVIPFFARMSGITGEFICVCVATCCDNPLETKDMLKGRLFIFQDEEIWDQQAVALVHGAQEMLRNFVGFTGGADLFGYFDSTHTDLLNALPPVSDFFVDFELSRSGITTLSIADNYTALISPLAPTFPSAPKERQHMERVVCSQLFFFLKDLAHNHQHHDPKLDTLVDIHPFVDEKEWRSKVLRYLYRKIIEYKRGLRSEYYHSSLGILIYAKSFRGITDREETIKDLPPVIQDDLLEDAIKAGLQNTCFLDESGKEGIKNLNFFVAVGTFILTIAMLVSLTDYKVKNPDPALTALADLLVKYTIPLIGSAYVCYMVVEALRGKRELSRRSRTALLILQPFNQLTAAIFPFVAGAVSVGLCLWFLDSWYNFPVLSTMRTLIGQYSLGWPW